MVINSHKYRKLAKSGPHFLGQILVLVAMLELLTGCDSGSSPVQPTGMANQNQPASSPHSNTIAPVGPVEVIVPSTATATPVILHNNNSTLIIPGVTVGPVVNVDGSDENDSTQADEVTNVAAAQSNSGATHGQTKETEDSANDCLAPADFLSKYGSYQNNLDNHICLKATVSSAGARIPAGAVHIDFKEKAGIEGIIPAQFRFRFDKAYLDSLRGKQIELHGVIAQSSVIKVPILEVDQPNQIIVL